MRILSFIKSPFRTPRVKHLENQLEAREEFVHMADLALQAASQITVGETDDESSSNKHYTGNPYKTYASKVGALTKMYEGKKDWGNDVAKNVVDIRAAFLVGSGVKVVPNEDYKGNTDREIDFINSFIAYNNIDKDTPLNWASRAEIEGKFLCRFENVMDNPIYPLGMVRVVHVSWNTNSYTVEHEPNNYDRFTRAYYNNGGSGTNFNLTPPEFIYRRFAGSAGEINETPSKAAMVLRNIQDLDKAYWDWRQIDHLYASPTPAFAFENSDEAKNFYNSASFKNWRIGKGIVLGGGVFKLECYKGEGFMTLEKEIQYHSRKISGATGIPPHFFGYPDLLSNRDTAEALIEAIILSTDKEQKTWASMYEELFQKVIYAHNKWHSQNLNPAAVDVVVPRVGSANAADIQKVWLPLYNAQAISLETLLNQLNNVDADKEIEKIKKDLEDAILHPSTDPGSGGGANNQNGGSVGTGQNQDS